MGKMTFEVPHQLSKDEARARVEKLVAHWAGKYGVKVAWNGDSAHMNGKVMGISIDANLHVTDKKVHGEATDPGLLFRSKAKQYLTEKFTSYLDPKKAPADG